jgi:hypothetical protein
VLEPKTVKDRIHLDFVVADIDEAIQRVMKLGGRPIDDPRPGGGITMPTPRAMSSALGCSDDLETA